MHVAWIKVYSGCGGREEKELLSEGNVNRTALGREGMSVVPWESKPGYVEKITCGGGVEPVKQ